MGRLLLSIAATAHALCYQSVSAVKLSMLLTSLVATSVTFQSALMQPDLPTYPSACNIIADSQAVSRTNAVFKVYVQFLQAHC
jgi:hypothetical protein